MHVTGRSQNLYDRFMILRFHLQGAGANSAHVGQRVREGSREVQGGAESIRKSVGGGCGCAEDHPIAEKAAGRREAASFCQLAGELALLV